MKTFPVIDMHEDILLPKVYPHYDHPDVVQTGFGLLEDARVKIVVGTGFPWPLDEAHYSKETFGLLEADFRTYEEFCRENSSWRIVRSAQDVREVLESEGGHGVLLHIEGFNAFSGEDEEWEMLLRWYGTGLRSMGIVWNLQNNLGGGAGSQDEGLTELGVEMIEWCIEHRMIVDLAHTNERTFQDIARVVGGRQPLVISHGNVRALCEHSRNYYDSQLLEVAASGGIVGPFFAKNFIVREGFGTLDELVAHFVYLKKLIGVDHIGIGSDFGGLTGDFILGLSSVEEIPNLWEALGTAGFSDDEIEKIAWKNASRVLTEVLL